MSIDRRTRERVGVRTAPRAPATPDGASGGHGVIVTVDRPN
ncbi:hypothetical protein ACFYYB_19075 [Streptomyces sp. NPDC002886]